jgi:type IV pilus assembly protein PilM
MSLWSQITRLATEPPPSYVFELSEAGIAFARHGHTGFQPFEPGTLAVTPLQDNVLRPDVVAATLERIAPSNGNKKRRPAAVILPDHAVRVSLLDFDSFPAVAEEQQALVRFRIKKTIPYEIDSAAIRFWAQPSASNAKNGGKKTEVVVVTVALEILARYEALFRSSNFHPGDVTTSSLAALNLYRETGVAVIAKLAGNVLTILAQTEGHLKLFRCLEIDPDSDEDILSVLFPTFAFVEDELGQPVRKLILCGFDRVPAGLNVEITTLKSRAGVPSPFNAGLLGYLEAGR